MGRLIDADEMYDRFCVKREGLDGIYDANDLPEMLAEMSTVDAVPVIRCQDCKWWDSVDGNRYGYCHACKHSFYSEHWEISIHRTYRDDWFCADGERRDDDGGENDEKTD